MEERLKVKLRKVRKIMKEENITFGKAEKILEEREKLKKLQKILKVR